MKLSTMNRKLLVGLACALVVGVLALAGCSCAANSSSASASSSTSASSASSASADLQYTVPNVLSLTRSDAEKAILASGLRLGKVTAENSDTIPAGCVISQNPKPFTNAQANSMVDIVISKGKAEPKDVTMPDLTGKTQTDAEKTLADIGLVGIASNPEETTAVAPGLVFKQSVAAGTAIREGTHVNFTTALAPSLIAVPDVTGMTHNDAQATIGNAGLGFDFTVMYNDNVPADVVIAQSVAAGTQVQAGTIISVSISLGPAPQQNVKVPDVRTYSWSEAEASMRSAGLAVRYTGDAAGVVIAQDIVAGTEVAPGTLVTVRLAKSADYVEVPDLKGLSVMSAEMLTDQLGLGLDIEEGGFHGTITDQAPAPGTVVASRTVIRVKVDDSDFK